MELVEMAVYTADLSARPIYSTRPVKRTAVFEPEAMAAAAAAANADPLPRLRRTLSKFAAPDSHSVFFSINCDINSNLKFSCDLFRFNQQWKMEIDLFRSS